MKHFHKGHMGYCYHGTKPEFLNSIINSGLRVPNGKDVQVRNGSVYGVGIYSSKIPEYAQLYADPYEEKGIYYQVIFLLRQDLKEIESMTPSETYGKFSTGVSKEYTNMKYIHLLHSKLMKETDVQWMTKNEKSIVIEAILVKVHKVHPQFG